MSCIQTCFTFVSFTFIIKPIFSFLDIVETLISSNFHHFHHFQLNKFLVLGLLWRQVTTKNNSFETKLVTMKNADADDDDSGDTMCIIAAQKNDRQKDSYNG